MPKLPWCSALCEQPAAQAGDRGLFAFDRLPTPHG